MNGVLSSYISIHSVRYTYCWSERSSPQAETRTTLSKSGPWRNGSIYSIPHRLSLTSWWWSGAVLRRHWLCSYLCRWWWPWWEMMMIRDDDDERWWWWEMMMMRDDDDDRWWCWWWEMMMIMMNMMIDDDDYDGEWRISKWDEASIDHSHHPWSIDISLLLYLSMQQSAIYW